MRTTARVARLIAGKGFGFLTAPDGEDVFFHRSAVDGITGVSFDVLRVGDEVEAEIEPGAKGPVATVVRCAR